MRRAKEEMVGTLRFAHPTISEVFPVVIASNAKHSTYPQAEP
jgi:hypothetical protein